ncbi:hypothetical protein BV898_18174 [Hypsibius exemplaris]|uniref:HAT C-terminal dimerisation domain-containing protein n=1 Tax=Hypsibius exemplaris TaxID=2072580 RepID=A0A9X6RN86_HYPEX|nr:hypothetical protein BV898_18174 [Hypsibius exemplaris]
MCLGTKWTRMYDFSGQEFRIRCFCHAVNKVAEIGLLEKEEIVKLIREQVIFIKQPKMKAEFRKGLKKRDIKLCRDCPTRWNSTRNMLGSAVKLRAEISEFLSTQKGPISSSMLSNEQWNQADTLEKFLAPLEDSSLACGSGLYATLHLGIPHFKILGAHFQATITKEGVKPWLTTIAQKMNAKLVSVIKETWESSGPIIACLLNPYLKLLEFSGQQEIARVTGILKELFIIYAERYPASGQHGIPSGEPKSAYEEYIQSRVSNVASTESEIDRYLGTSPEPKCDVNDYWRKYEAVYPVLSKIARDYLAVCAYSVDSERSFSVSKNVVAGPRNRLGPKSLGKTMCLKSWYKIVCIQAGTLSEDITVLD